MKKIIIIFIAVTLSCCNSKFNVNGGVWTNPIPEGVRDSVNVLSLEKSLGVIFPKEYEVNFNKSRLLNRFTPSEEEIREAEIEINKQYLDAKKRFAYNQYFIIVPENNTDWNVEKSQKSYQNSIKRWSIKEAKKSIKFDRQYIGFIEDGEKILVIQFIDFSRDPHKLKNQLTESFIRGWHGWFATNVRLKEYNLNTKRLNSFGWSHL